MLDELILIDKPAGPTSHDIVDKVRRIFGTRKVGHAGTLDPFATGLLILGIGAGTKRLTALVGVDKEYIATALLGATSTTDDPEGMISKRNVTEVNRTDIESALASFLGEGAQTVPAFSAKKVGGKKLYDLARKGQINETILPIQHITIREIELLDYAWPTLTFRVACTSGTYIRALARDIGEKLNVGAYLTALRRTKVGPYRIEDALTLEALKEKTPNPIQSP